MSESPYVEPNESSAKAAENSTKTGAGVGAGAGASVGAGSWRRYMMYAAAIIIAFIIIWIVYKTTTGGGFGGLKGFITNPIKSDPAADWNLKSAIDKLIKKQEDALAKFTQKNNS
jgi:hypothetical protein